MASVDQVLSWGKGTIEVAPVTSTGIGAWKVIDTPKEGSFNLEMEEGEQTEAKEEGGDVVDVLAGASKYTLTFDLFVKKGVAKPFDDVDGFIGGIYAFRFTPLDPTCAGFLIEKAKVRVKHTYTMADGFTLTYTATAIKPDSGKTVKEYFASGLVVDKSELFFASTADTTGKVVNVTTTASSVTATPNESWVTASVSGKAVTIKTSSANTTGAPRMAVVVLEAGGVHGRVSVTQIPA